MRFTVLPAAGRIPRDASQGAYLHTDNWDDWFRFSTQYYLTYVDADGIAHDIGQVKIGQFGMTKDQRRPSIPENFEQLTDEFFSLGQDASYYEGLSAIGDDVREDVLQSLRDIALSGDLYARALNEDVTGISLMRGVPATTIEGQFSRLARGGARLSDYRFRYTMPAAGRERREPVSLDFDVVAESNPPTNIHVVIGRNGVGKTRLLNMMTRALIDRQSDSKDVGTFNLQDSDGQDVFANLVSVTFSAFDAFEPLSTPRNSSKTDVGYTYVGLKRTRRNADDKPLPPKSPATLTREFGDSVLLCASSPARLTRWRRALEALTGDPLFEALRVTELASEGPSEAVKESAQALFRGLSSGHKIVLLTITRLVERVEERTLVLLDEPEAHLHPPLLSAFVRALSDLLINRNGVAIIATHSPVVLQEVPKHCAWTLRRTGRIVTVDRPEVETFGENVGVLTREVFGLEVSQSGFHRLLREAVIEDEGTYDEVLAKFGGALGSEARGLAQALVAARRARGRL
ncbi:AAA domain-containing protein, putative AbiEii toxin, Type IV TA system [Geodermatophilus africanus]|uniref:AAA domain-containing protein, putative AbiEii toxin, Type IV TA system n=1 Tax=Geodermatophilus africanus TaxID=1137993 RepID=A0A1H3M8K1_9ACTN|nr:AAA family ATPase [Geodermatophilus africanus]SDY72906.1 AAA domain-containing protein, putative AbiEii toxin, Type IV TA system [Geodermatophilus africanus]